MLVNPVSILSNDIHALTILNKYQTNPLRPVIPKEIEMDFYGFLDASGSGYGISLQLTQNKKYNPEHLM